MSMATSINSEVARHNPEALFRTPQELVECNLLTLGQKFATLKRWRQAAIDRLDATSEGMPDNGTAKHDTELLDRIAEAQAQLDEIHEQSRA